MSLNKIIIMGRLAQDPEIRQVSSGSSAANFTLAVARDFKNKQTNERETDWIDVVAWASRADFAKNYLSKGRNVVAEGRLQIRKWEDNDGKKRTSAEVVANNLYFADSKQSPETMSTDESTNDTFTDDLPF